jgi:multidrug efflux pump subunit AcrB
MAVPGALAGVLWMLVLTGTTINVESLMGAIMAVGVGVANGNLLITFANGDRVKTGVNSGVFCNELAPMSIKRVLKFY